MVDRNRLVRYATRRLGQDGEDAVQEAYLRAWEKYRDPALLDHAGMMQKVLSHVVVEHIRRQARHPPPLPLMEWIPDPLDVEDEAIIVDELEQVLLVLGPSPDFPLPEIVLSALGWTIRELAGMAGVPRQTIMSRIVRQRSRLWKELRP
ncbi:RNA polymerase sigma factor [Thermomicrobium sp.]|uniref:RNA polymerase sigma factor n=1 Tax=Thermomicrobium sp. TaxID=1969469 RepID=UPI001B0DC422|nr:RNA polymerase sigma factor [Thermomicrobium sp.]MBO9308003.1 RNA polymerase sigma factor [Thermomicrobium sp.]